MNRAVVDTPTAPPTLSALLSWDIPPLPVLPITGIVMAALYCWGLHRVRKKSIYWSPWRSASFLLGCLFLVLVTGLQVERYGYSMFSVFMFQHLTLSMTIPPLLVLGSPGRMLLRATSHHGCGRWILVAALTGLRSRAGRIALHPGVTIPLFLFSYYGLYLSSIFDGLAVTVIGHVSMEVFFFASGLLFIIPILAVGPLPVRQTNLGRMFDLFVEMPLHVFFGVILMMTSTPMLSTFASPPPEWGVDPVDDQKLAGALAWSYGEPVALLVVLIFCIRWNRDEKDQSALADRQAEEDGYSELNAYNEFLKTIGTDTRRHR
ncbi:cytochrome c oxidase assembly protein [Rhodococcus sp. BP-252]|uniref:Cytochrome c oxidase assembly protein n=1 Tax=Rhodococcoides kyotonense TaxID=398843 RepID=A0A177YLI9_9NOCA|nr:MULTISPECIES: cytochrome c oxidase assembly protein [Rhodococcus]MBY6413941.1 cytochrome c oxidase assembly protein [Rhodococcus sp. BP-320]MBY6418609.1 cytochrome c oxidase assembly protein [Rhodococcus sp. BP-321]MBY6422904.1 cytochrome c oxidase assembly protein [Rhodococcus sp. BP-324]MBY6428747.1 cytochrome c oxidase assembly protein [Rhodococcus sp. BP-323]MBY6433730.1 cytochrome c oxidase assembly protein [Rhodococcus sp. BP-322]